MTPYLLLTLDGMHYGIEAALVREICWLPELNTTQEAPAYIAGVFNLRGTIEPVMNLGLRLGHPPARYRLSDHIVMIQADGMTMGLIVNEVSDIVTIPATAIEPPLQYDGDSSERDHFLAGNAKVDQMIIMLLDAPSLLHTPALPATGVSADHRAYFCPDATAEERAVFHTRAHNLMPAEEGPGAAERIPLSIIELGGECFGVELGVVCEFCHLHRVTAIPCCPPHIAGNMNLRGDILTLLDIRTLLSIPAGNAVKEVMVVKSGDLHIGVVVNRVLEVIYLPAGDITPLPVATRDEQPEYCKGVARYGERMFSILDMQTILSQGALEVEEEV